MRTISENDKDYICEINAPCFQNLAADETDLVRASKTQVLFRKGDNLTKQGTFTSYILFLLNGLAKQYLEGDGSKSLNLRIIQPGEFIGLSSVFSTNKFNYSVVALSDCRAYLIEKDSIAKLARQNGMFGFSIIKRYCEQNNNLFEKLKSQAYKQMNGRLAETLLYIDTLKKGHPEIFSLMSRKDIADFAGISTESAVKLLKGFEKDGLLQLHEKDVVIIDPYTLGEISKRG